MALTIVALAAALAKVQWSAPAPLPILRERLFDLVMRSPEQTPRILVVDIGEADPEGRPWSRAATARLIDALAAAKPAVIANDIVYSGTCDASVENGALADALARAPVALGFLFISTEGDPPVPPSDVGVTSAASRLLWQVPGAEAPCPAFTAAAQGLGSVVLVGDDDGLVRRVAAAVLVAGHPYLPLAAEAVRIATGGDVPLIAADPAPVLRLAGAVHHLDPDGAMRLAVTGPGTWASRTLGAQDVLAGRGLERVTGALVFVGSSLPRRGGLRATAASPVAPSVQVQADLATSLLAQALPYRPVAAPGWETGFVAGMGILVVSLAFMLPALPAFAVAVLVAAGWAGLGLWFVHRGILIDPVFPAVAGFLIALAALVAKAVATARAEAALRARMGQLLPPAVVTLLAENPGLLRLKGETREVTSLFADIEGFSGMTHRLGPEALVAVLDRYFTLTCGIVLRHGGMIDKIVGDSVHALFNAPLDQPRHVDAALACAAEILAATDELRRAPETAAAGLGATRIGLEAGTAMLGDVGSGARINYTAYGDVVNLAARLQDVNKDLHTRICVGPKAAALATEPLQLVGDVEVRSFGRVAVFTLPGQSPTLA